MSGKLRIFNIQKKFGNSSVLFLMEGDLHYQKLFSFLLIINGFILLLLFEWNEWNNVINGYTAMQSLDRISPFGVLNFRIRKKLYLFSLISICPSSFHKYLSLRFPFSLHSFKNSGCRVLGFKETFWWITFHRKDEKHRETIFLCKIFSNVCYDCDLIHSSW